MSAQEEIDKLSPEDRAKAKAIGQGINEMAESLTGFEEIGIKEAFGDDWSDLAGVMQARSFIFVQRKREGLNHADAFQAAMEMTNKAVQEFYLDDDEPMPEEPTTELGKDASLAG